MKLIGHSDIGGRGDGLQLMVHRGHAYVAHPWSQGFSIIDVRDPANPKTVNYVAGAGQHLEHPPAAMAICCWSSMRWIFSRDVDTFTDEKTYYHKSVGETVAAKKRERAWTAGMTVFDISVPDRPRKVGQLDVDGVGFHRLWYVGGGVMPMPRRCSTDFQTISSSPSTWPIRQSRNWWGVVAAGHEPGRRRGAELGRGTFAMRCITPLFTGIPPMPAGAMVA